MAIRHLKWYFIVLSRCIKEREREREGVALKSYRSRVSSLYVARLLLERTQRETIKFCRSNTHTPPYCIDIILYNVHTSIHGKINEIFELLSERSRVRVHGYILYTQVVSSRFCKPYIVDEISINHTRTLYEQKPYAIDNNLSARQY